MIISDKYKIIFIHIPKNAGTYITKILEDLDPNIKRYHLNGNGHITAFEAIKLIGFEKWNSYIKFCVIRNIYDKTYSYYNYVINCKFHYQHEVLKTMSFEEYINSLPTYDKEYINGNLLNSPYIFNKEGEQLVDYILKFETLNDDITNFFKTLNIPNEISKEKINNFPHENYKNMYNEQMNKILNDIAQKDFQHFGFIF